MDIQLSVDPVMLLMLYVLGYKQKQLLLMCTYLTMIYSDTTLFKRPVYWAWRSVKECYYLYTQTTSPWPWMFLTRIYKEHVTNIKAALRRNKNFWKIKIQSVILIHISAVGKKTRSVVVAPEVEIMILTLN